jgi:Zn-dependent protease with chaperone function
MRLSWWIILVVLIGALGMSGGGAYANEEEKQPPASLLTDRVAVPEPSEKALDYYYTGNVLWIINWEWEMSVLCLILFTGFSAWIRHRAERIGRKWFITFIIYYVLLSLLVYLIHWPLGYYQGFLRQHSYGLSNQTFAKWQRDSLMGLGIGILAGLLFLWIPYLLMRISPRRWWLYTGIVLVPVIFFAVLIEPIWIEPLYNKSREMKDKALEAKILALADSAGIQADKVYEVNKSEDTKTVNAYVTGFLNTKRIVLWDTLLNNLDEKEVLFVMGHEMGHYVLNHIIQGTLFAIGLVFIGLYVVHRLSRVLIRRWQNRFGFDQLGDVASWPLIVLLGQFFYFLALPGAMAFSRHLEHEADRFGLEITQDNHAAAMGFVKLQENNLGNPRPGWLFKLWRASHPTLAERIEFCNDYRPWEHGEPLKYGELFHGAGVRGQESGVRSQESGVRSQESDRNGK